MINAAQRLLAIILVSALGACGFQPLYGELSNGEAVTADLSSIDIASNNSRLGVTLRNFLIDQFHPNGRSDNNTYRLDFRLREGQVGAGERLDASVTRYKYRLTVNYRLVDIEKGGTVYEGQSFSAVSYDVVDSQFATVVSREDAQERAAREISDDIKLRLALYFNQRGKTAQNASGA